MQSVLSVQREIISGELRIANNYWDGAVSLSDKALAVGLVMVSWNVALRTRG